MMMHGGGMAWLMVVGLLVWVGLVAVAGWAVGRYVSTSRATRQIERRPPERDTPLDVLERRYAEGAIDVDEFDEARARIRED